MTFLRAASFGMPALTRYTAQTCQIVVRPWLTSRRTPTPRARSLRLKSIGPGRARSRSVPRDVVLRVTGSVSRSLVAWRERAGLSPLIGVCPQATWSTVAG